MNKNILLVGLPETGKTTFLAALWYYVYSNIEPKSLKLVRFSGDDTYLNKIRDYWLECEPVPRTQTDQKDGENVQLYLELTKTQEQIILSVPDFSGETFRLFWEDRKWSIEIENLFNSISGILLFVHTEKYVPHSLIYDLNNIEFLLEENARDANVSLNEWNISQVPTQVRLVDLLQFFLYHTSLTFPIRLSIILSAWDKITKDYPNLNPDRWLTQRFPLLDQFIKSNKEYYISRVFGVSAQGGEYYKNKEKENLLEKEEPAERIKIQIDDKVENDIGLPISWLIE